MSTLRRIWQPVADALSLDEQDAGAILYAACVQAAEDEPTALRIHGALAARFGLRERLSPPRFKAEYEALPPDPLAGGRKSTEVAYKRAIASWRGQHLARALAATADLAARKRSRGQWGDTVAPHPTGNPAADRQEGCVDCAWIHETPAGLRCRRASQLVAADQKACAAWEPPLYGDPDPCAPCGACCRGRFDFVRLRDSDPDLPGLVEEIDGERRIRHTRDGGCLALSREAPYRCTVHEQRPFICRDFPVGEDACCEARRHMGVVG